MIRRATPLILAAAVLTAAVPAPARAAEPQPTKVATVEGITEYQLSNGLRVLLYPDASKPLVTVNMTVLVGSRHEGYGEAGMAHLLEHMLFRGTPTHPGDLKKRLRERGANPLNGTTSYDRTNYYETLPASDENLEFALRLEADRLVNCPITREDLITEMPVVRNEFEDREDDPSNILRERMMAAAYEWHNYGKTLIGNRSDIERVPVENLQAFYKKYYRPDNVVLTIAGRFDEAKALAYVARYFGPLKRPDRKLDPTYTCEPAQDGERQVALRRVGSVGAVGVMYHVPAATHPDFAAVQVLARCLSREPGGRLYQALVETGKATDAGASAAVQHDPGVLWASASADPAGVDAARDALIEVLEGMDKAPITDREVADAMRGYAGAIEQAVADSHGFARNLSNWIAAGDWRLFFVHRDRMERVTAADVNRVARAYLVRSNRTVGVYHPTDKPQRAPVPDAPAAAEVVKGYTGRAAAPPAAPAFDPTPANLERQVVRGTLGPIKTAFLPKKTPGDQVLVRLTLRYGNEQSLTGNELAAEFLPDLLLAGTKRRTEQQLVDEVNRLGAGLAVVGDPGSLTVVAQSRRANLPAVLKLVGEILREPAFPAPAFDRLKAATVQNLAAGKADPMSRASDAVVRKIKNFPRGNIRYTPTADELAERVRGLSLDRVRAVYQTQVGAQAGELVAVGDFDPRVVTAELGPVLEGWTAAVPYRRVEVAVTPVAAGERIVIDTPDKANAAYVAAIALPVTLADPDYPALVMAQAVFGGGPSSRLWRRVRETEGLSYDVRAYLTATAQDRAAVFEINAIANPANIAKVDALIAEEIDKFLRDGVTEEELAAAKKANRETLKTLRAGDDNLLAMLSAQLVNGWTFHRQTEMEERLEALILADLQRAFRKHVDPKKLVIVHAGDFKKATK